MVFKTEQENFWASEFGDEYICRNHDLNVVAGNVNFFSKFISRIIGVNFIIAFAANIGLNFEPDYKKDLELIDYGFLYHRDNNDYLYDDINWFLMKKC